MTVHPGDLSVEAYLAVVPEQRRPALERLRELVHQHLPDHVEDMTYKMPSYSANGQVEVAFASQKQYISVYFLLPSVMQQHHDRLQGHNYGKCCLRFSHPDRIDWPLLADLLVTTRSAEDRSCS